MARLVVVTGGNRGLGLETCRLFVSNGDKVILTSRQQEAGVAAAKKIETRTESHGTVAVAPLDISSSESIDRFADLMKEDYAEQIDILVNNAGILESGWTPEEYERALNVNVKGQVQMTKRIVPLMREGGRVVMVSSVLALTVPGGSDYRRISDAATLEDLFSIPFIPEDMMKNGHAPTYSISKFMLNKAAKILSESSLLKERQISIDCVHPGWCRTDMGTTRATSPPEDGAIQIFNVANKDPPTTGKFYLEDEMQEI